MKFRSVLLIWVIATITYAILAIESPSWDSFYFVKDCLLPLFLIKEFYYYMIKKSDKAVCIIAIAIYGTKVLIELGSVIGVIDINKQIHTTIYVIFLLLILITFGYDTKKHRQGH